jgi:hypothetical protein
MDLLILNEAELRGPSNRLMPARLHEIDPKTKGSYK